MLVYLAESRLTVNEAAKVLNLSVSTLNKLRLFGGGPNFEKLTKSVRYRYESLLEWARSNTRTSTSDSGKAA
jgi:hypothetical protein